MHTRTITASESGRVCHLRAEVVWHGASLPFVNERNNPLIMSLNVILLPKANCLPHRMYCCRWSYLSTLFGLLFPLLRPLVRRSNPPMFNLPIIDAATASPRTILIASSAPAGPKSRGPRAQDQRHREQQRRRRQRQQHQQPNPRRMTERRARRRRGFRRQRWVSWTPLSRALRRS